MPPVRRAVALTTTQRTIVSTLLAELAPTNSPLALQAETALAVSNCECGCPSIDIVTDSSASASSSVDDVDMVAREPHRLLSAVLSVRNGRLTELDCVSQGRLSFFPPGLAEISGWVMTAEPVASTREP